MSGGTVLTDNSLYSRIDQGMHKVEKVFNLFAGIVVLALMLLAVTQVLSRKFFNAPVPGFIDWVEQFMAIFALIGIAYCHRIGGHIRMDIVIGQLKGRFLWLAEIISTLLMILITVALIFGSYYHFERSIKGDFWENISTLFSSGFSAFFVASSNDSTIDIALPLWPFKFLVPLSLSLLLIRLLLHLWGYTRAFINNENEPVGVPLPIDVATHAKMEAELMDGINDKNGAS
ncbi:MAG: TRAP transporter small permease subunit [Methyloligellaceae bacterium]